MMTTTDYDAWVWAENTLDAWLEAIEEDDAEESS